MENEKDKELKESIKAWAVRIKLARKSAHWSQEQFAREIGVSWVSVNKWENLKCRPSYLAIEKMRERFRGVFDFPEERLPIRMIKQKFEEEAEKVAKEVEEKEIKQETEKEEKKIMWEKIRSESARRKERR